MQGDAVHDEVQGDGVRAAVHRRRDGRLGGAVRAPLEAMETGGEGAGEKYSGTETGGEGADEKYPGTETGGEGANKKSPGTGVNGKASGAGRGQTESTGGIAREDGAAVLVVAIPPAISRDRDICLHHRHTLPDLPSLSLLSLNIKSL